MIEPTEEDFTTIKNWGIKNYEDLIAFVKERWRYADCGYWSEDDNVLTIATGGWSDNETIIHALGCTMFWVMCWESSHRGGKYVFDLSRNIVKKNNEEKTNKKKSF